MTRRLIHRYVEVMTLPGLAGLVGALVAYTAIEFSYPSKSMLFGISLAVVLSMPLFVFARCP
jgi:hypothetical protein